MGSDWQSEVVVKDEPARPRRLRGLSRRELPVSGLRTGGTRGGAPHSGTQSADRQVPTTAPIAFFGLNPLLTAPWAAYGST